MSTTVRPLAEERGRLAGEVTDTGHQQWSGRLGWEGAAPARRAG